MILINTKTGEELDGFIEEMEREEVLNLKNNSDFSFDWALEKENQVYKLQLFDEEEILGLISLIDVPREFRLHINLIESAKKHRGKGKIVDNIPGCLIAFTCKKAFLSGYDGFVSLTPKTQLVEYYRIKHGFIQIGNQMAVFDKAAKLLITKYLGDGFL
ncbi:MAG: hypothetical protein MRY78_16450 [Saprospiraceae bacterium]|nr:hypothetical protein [Saprospiraceae bacterium]